MSDYDEIRERQYREEVEGRNNAAWDALSSSFGPEAVIGGAIDFVSNGLKSFSDAVEATIEHTKAISVKIWNITTEVAQEKFEAADKLKDAGEWDAALKEFDFIATKTQEIGEDVFSQITPFITDNQVKSNCREYLAVGCGEYAGKSYACMADIYVNQKNDWENAIKYAEKAVVFYEKWWNFFTGNEWPTYSKCMRGLAYEKKAETLSGEAQEECKQRAINDFKSTLDLAEKDWDQHKIAAEHLKNMGVKYKGNLGILKGFLIWIAVSVLSFALYGGLAGFIIAFLGFWPCILGPTITRTFARGGMQPDTKNGWLFGGILAGLVFILGGIAKVGILNIIFPIIIAFVGGFFLGKFLGKKILDKLPKKAK